MTQEQVNTQVTQALRDEGVSIPLRNVEVTLQNDNRVRATGFPSVSGQGEMPLTVDLSVASQGGKLQVEILSASSGVFPIPTSMVESTVKHALLGTDYSDIRNIRLPDDVERVAVEQGSVVIHRK